MSEANYSIERDLTEAKALADHLIPYVYEDQVYGSIGGMFGSSNLPSLTLGALLMRLRRLHALEAQLSDTQKTQLAATDALNESIRREWTIHYNNKLIQEATSRLKMMDKYIAECVEDVRSCANNYPPEALRRTIVEEIITALNQYGAPNADVERAAQKVDSGLRRFAQPSDFVWAGTLSAAYPQDQYWWLYSRPPRTGKK